MSFVELGNYRCFAERLINNTPNLGNTTHQPNILLYSFIVCSMTFVPIPLSL
jgi:hypothetical protein